MDIRPSIHPKADPLYLILLTDEIEDEAIKQSYVAILANHLSRAASKVLFFEMEPNTRPAHPAFIQKITDPTEAMRITDELLAIAEGNFAPHLLTNYWNTINELAQKAKTPLTSDTFKLDTQTTLRLHLLLSPGNPLRVAYSHSRIEMVAPATKRDTDPKGSRVLWNSHIAASIRNIHLMPYAPNVDHDTFGPHTFWTLTSYRLGNVKPSLTATAEALGHVLLPSTPLTEIVPEINEPETGDNQ